ncbi:MAG: arsenate reductase (azurin) small subunit [Proteobacteria bacterium]|nr:arsenate reductase (azurin) small subunit [Pseudomonadota bacterium]
MSTHISRRRFLRQGGTATAAVAVAGCSGKGSQPEKQPEPGPLPSPPPPNTLSLPYPENDVGKARPLVVGKPQTFQYPDSSSPCIMLKVGEPVPGGVGRDRDIVAYSSLCSHQGCPVVYDEQERVLKCPCHFSIFDPARAGQVVCGQATVQLPRIVLSYDESKDTVRAVGVDGLIYGRASNV